jgi:hypothetical protein
MVFEFIKEIANPQDKTTPTLTNIFNEFGKSLSSGIKVSCPAKIIKYDRTKQVCDVRPCGKKTYKDGKSEQEPIIYNVPVAFPRSGSSIISMPLKKDDYVMLVFQDHSIEEFQNNGGEVAPADSRTHDLSDAVAYPGFYPSNAKKSVANSTDIIILNEESGNKLEIRVKPNGKIQILNNSNDLVAVLDDCMRVIRAAVVYTCNGPKKLRHAEFTTVHNKLKTFVSK